MDVEQLNALIPPDLTAEELVALVGQLKSKKGKLATDPIGVMEAVQRAVAKVRPTAPVTTAEDAAGAETVPEPAAADKDEETDAGDGKGEGLRDHKTDGEIASGKIRYVTKLEVEGVSLARIHFTSFKGVSAATKPRKKPRTLTVTFTHDGVQRTVRFLIVVKHAEPDGSEILAENHKTWEIPDTGIHMRAGESVTLHPKK
jgi:hypothetical protein